MTSWPCFVQPSPSGGQSRVAAPLQRCNKSVNKEIYIMSPAVIAGMTHVAVPVTALRSVES